MDVGDLVRHCVLAFCAGAPPSRQLDSRITTVLGTIRESEDLRMSLEAAAASVHLSPGRFAHLFKDSRPAVPALHAVAQAHARHAGDRREAHHCRGGTRGDFADAAHLTRTFHQMFGIPPSVLMRGEFFEIAPPFAAPG